MATSLDEVQEDIFKLLDDAFVQPVIEQTVEDTVQLPRNVTGDIEPIISVQFGVLQNGRLQSFSGSRGHDYILPVYVQVVAHTPALARKLGNKVIDTMLGYDTDWTGQVTMRPGGSLYPIAGSDNTVAATVFPLSFGVPIQFQGGL